MARKTIQKKIKSDEGIEFKYSQKQFGAEKGVELMPVLFEFLGEVGGQLSKSLFDENQSEALESESLFDLNFNPIAAGKAVAKIGTELTKAGNLEFIKSLLSECSRENEDGEIEKVEFEFDDIYAGNYGELGRVLWFVIDFNYGPSWRAGLKTNTESESFRTKVQTAILSRIVASVN